MVRENNGKINRRKVLKLSGTGFATFTGAALSATSASGSRTPSRRRSDDGRRTHSGAKNEVQFESDGKIGFAKGAVNEPVTEDTVLELYSQVLGSNLERDSLALPRPVKDEQVSTERTHNSKDVLGVVVSVGPEGPAISVDRKPPQIDHLSREEQRAVEAEKHDIVERKVTSEKQAIAESGSVTSEGADDVVRFDDNVELHHSNEGADGDSCSEKVGEFRLYSRLERNDYVDEETGNDRSEWAMSQKGFMWPLVANHEEWDFFEDYFGDQWECWRNKWTELSQNWDRSELDDLGIRSYDPSQDDETQTEISGSVSASIPRSVGVSVSVDAPNLELQSELNGKQLRATYDYQGGFGDLDAADDNVQLGTATAWDSKAPDWGDRIAPTYMYGGFTGYDWKCLEYWRCNDDNPAKETGSLFNFFYEYEIDDI